MSPLRRLKMDTSRNMLLYQEVGRPSLTDMTECSVRQGHRSPALENPRTTVSNVPGHYKLYLLSGQAQSFGHSGVGTFSLVHFHFYRNRRCMEIVDDIVRAGILCFEDS